MYIYIILYHIHTWVIYNWDAHPSRIGAAMSRQVKEKLHHFDGRFRCNTKKTNRSPDKWFISFFIRFSPSKVVKDFFHPQYVYISTSRVLGREFFADQELSM